MKLLGFVEMCLENNIPSPACGLTSLSNFQWHSDFKPQICKQIHFYVICANGRKAMCPVLCFLLCRKHVFLMNDRVLMSYGWFYTTVVSPFCMCMHIYLKICMCIYTHIYVHVNMNMNMNINMNVYIYISVRVYMHVHAHTYIQIYFYTRKHAYIHTHLNYFLLFCISIMRNLFQSV